jgi:hypothetical protein
METLKQIRQTARQARRNFQFEVGLFVAANPRMSFREVAEIFQCSEWTVSNAARLVGLKPRSRGRKKAEPPGVK